MSIQFNIDINSIYGLCDCYTQPEVLVIMFLIFAQGEIEIGVREDQCTFVCSIIGHLWPFITPKPAYLECADTN